MKLTDEEQKFAINAKVGVYPGLRYVTDTSSGSACWGGWETLIVRRSDIVARGRADTRELAFQNACKLYDKLVQRERSERVTSS